MNTMDQLKVMCQLMGFQLVDYPVGRATLKIVADRLGYMPDIVEGCESSAWPEFFFETPAQALAALRKFRYAD